MEYGRPESIDLLVLINRKFTRQVPIEPAFVGKSIDQYDRQKVKVLWQKDGEGENQVVLSQE
jgi:pyrimidine operon attenuation protein/uracil phosphoribosyltransferase